MKLANLLRRDPAAPSLRERAAGLRVLLGKGRPQPSSVPTLELASNQSANDHDVTKRGADEEIDAIAELEFRAYTLDDPVKTPQQWADKFAAHAMMMHVADRTLRMTKPELIAFIRDAGEQDAETPEIMFRGIDGAQETFQGWGELLGVARARYIVAASAACTEPPAQTEAPVADLTPAEPVAADTHDRTDLAAACDQAVIDWRAIQPKSRAENWGEAQLDEALDAYGAVFKRAIQEPSITLSETQAKARLLLHDLREHEGTDEGEEHDDKRLIRVVLHEVAGLTDKAAVPKFNGIHFGQDTHIAELAAEFCRIYARHAVKDRAHMAGDLAEAEWLPSYRATVALMEKLEATRPKTLLGAALKALGPIGAAGWNARADGSTDGMDVWERVGAQFQDALMADALAPISIAGPDLVGLVNFQAATMDELHAVYDMANEVSAFAYALVSSGRGSVQDRHSYDGRLTPAGNLMLWVAEALSSVEDAAYNEIKRRKPTDHREQETRLRVLASLLIGNGDKAETAAFARELLAFAGE